MQKMIATSIIMNVAPFMPTSFNFKNKKASTISISVSTKNNIVYIIFIFIL